ncbi:MAG: VCBS repeat-containing protein [Planctomycetes bacterium]|nr:VCBS repeat-containing protein [Planctomycetota bacterium]
MTTTDARRVRITRMACLPIMYRHFQRAVLAVAAPLAAAPLASSQSACYEPLSTTVFTGTSRTVAVGDFDGDGDLDLVSSDSVVVSIAYNDGAGGFTTPQALAPWPAERVAVADFDGDGRPDVLAHTFGGGFVLWNEGGLTWTAAPACAGCPNIMSDFAIGDVDGDGLLDIVGMFDPGWPASMVGHVFHNDGARGFWETSFSVPYGANTGTALADIDADGDLDFVITHASTQVVTVCRNDGLGWFGSEIVLPAVHSPTLVVAANLDGYPGMDVAAIDLGNRTLAVWRALSPGYFAPRLDFPFGGTTVVPLSLSAFDIDSDGDLDLVAAAQVNGAGGAHGRMLLFRNSGVGTFTAETLFEDPQPLVEAVIADLDGDSDGDLATVAMVTGTNNTVAVRLSCQTTIQFFCAGDGTVATACPCSNFGAAGHGCANSTGTAGALLVASGSTSPDTLILQSSGEPPTAASVFLQGTASIPAGSVFGDGVRCVGGLLKRLYIHNAVGGVATAPNGAEPSITIQSAALGDVIAPGMTRYYQVYYRDPAPGFCSPSTFNISGALQITW